MAHVKFVTEAAAELRALEGSARKKVLAKLVQLESRPEMGHPLGARAAGNLTSFRKAVVGKNTYRIVYRLGPDDELLVVWVVSGRSDGECYKVAAQRLAQYGDHPQVADLTEVLRSLQRG